VTARDLAILSRALIKEFPQYQQYFSEKYYTWNKIRQPNRNRLLFSDPSVDGLKTGHTQKAGYCLIATAKREKLRLIAVVMGAASEQARVNDATALLNFGSNFFESRKLFAALAAIDDLKVWKGAQSTVPVGSLNDVYITVPKTTAEDLETLVRADTPLVAPIPDRLPAGTLKVVDNDQTLASIPLYTLSSVPEGNIFRRAIDSAKMWINSVDMFPTIR
jgi:D-alanyl-D-alanine carboxypeptidase (penicillin-binding protein 5/6)